MDLGGIGMEYKYYQNTLNKILKEQIKSQKNLNKLKIKTYIDHFLREVEMYINYLKIDVKMNKQTKSTLKDNNQNQEAFFTISTFTRKKTKLKSNRK